MPVLFAVVCLLSLEVGFSQPLWGGEGSVGDGTSWFEEMASSLNSGYKQPQVPSPGERPDQPAQPNPQPNPQPAQPNPDPALKDAPNLAGQNPGVAQEGPQNTASEVFQQPFMKSPQNLFSFLFDPYFKQPQYAVPQNQWHQNDFKPSNADFENQPNAPSQPESPGLQPGQDATIQAVPNPSDGGVNPAFPNPAHSFQDQQNPSFKEQAPGTHGPGKQYVYYHNPILSELGYIDRLMRNFMFW